MNENMNEELFNAVKSGDLSVVSEMLGNGADVNVQDRSGFTGLMLASQGGYAGIVRLFIDKGARLDIQSYDTDSMLTWSVDDPPTIPQIEAEWIRLKGTTDKTALMIAASKGYTDIVEMLVIAGAALDLQDRSRDSALLLAIEAGHIDIAGLLIDKGASLEKDTFSRTALICAAFYRRTVIVQMLIDRGVNLDLRSNDYLGATALICACGNGATDVARSLIDHGASLNIASVNNFGGSYGSYCSTALMTAAREGRVDTVRLLVDRGSALDLKNKNRETALMAAIEKGHTDIVRFLIHKGAGLDLMSDDVHSLWLLAIKKGYTDIVRMLIDKGFNIDSNNGRSQVTGLMIAIYFGNIDIVRLLLDKGAKLNLRSAYSYPFDILPGGAQGRPNDDPELELGETALMITVRKGYVDLVGDLIDRGADMDLQTGSGLTALIWAVKVQNLDIVKLLINKGADLNLISKVKRISEQSPSLRHIFEEPKQNTACDIAESCSFYCSGRTDSVAVNAMAIKSFLRKAGALTAYELDVLEQKKRSELLAKAVLAVPTDKVTQLDDPAVVEALVSDHPDIGESIRAFAALTKEQKIDAIKAVMALVRSNNAALKKKGSVL